VYFYFILLLLYFICLVCLLLMADRLHHNTLHTPLFDTHSEASQTDKYYVSNSILKTNERMDTRTKRHVSNGHRYVPLSVCPLCLSEASILCGERSAMLHRNLRWINKNPGSINKYTKFSRLIIRKIIKLLPRLKCTKFDSWRLSVRLFVRLFVHFLDEV